MSVFSSFGSVNAFIHEMFIGRDGSMLVERDALVWNGENNEAAVLNDSEHIR